MQFQLLLHPRKRHCRPSRVYKTLSLSVLLSTHQVINLRFQQLPLRATLLKISVFGGFFIAFMWTKLKRRKLRFQLRANKNVCLSTGLTPPSFYSFKEKNLFTSMMHSGRVPYWRANHVHVASVYCKVKDDQLLFLYSRASLPPSLVMWNGVVIGTLPSFM